MVNSISGANVPGLLAVLMKEAAARQDLAVTMVKKTQDVEKMQGEAALKLIEAAGNASQSGTLDVYA